MNYWELNSYATSEGASLIPGQTLVSSCPIQEHFLCPKNISVKGPPRALFENDTRQLRLQKVLIDSELRAQLGCVGWQSGPKHGHHGHWLRFLEVGILKNWLTSNFEFHAALFPPFHLVKKVIKIPTTIRNCTQITPNVRAWVQGGQKRCYWIALSKHENGVAASDVRCFTCRSLSLSSRSAPPTPLRHAPLAEVDLVGLAPDLEVAELLDGEPVGQHQHHVLLVVLAYPSLHLRVGPARQENGSRYCNSVSFIWRENIDQSST